MKTILIALDFAPVSSLLIKYAKNYAHALDAEILLLHVATAVRDLYIGYNLGSQDLMGAGMPMYYSDEGVMDVIQQELEQEHKQLMEYVREFKDRNISISGILRQGPIVETILEEAEKKSANMIIVGSHGHNPLRRVILGSVSEGIVANASCPVLVIPSKCADPDEQ